MAFRIALLGIYHESNTFLSQPTTLTDFEKGHWLFGADIISEYKDAYHEVGGMIEGLEDEEIVLLPVMFAEATPGGTITSDTYFVLLEEMIACLEKILPVDGCLVVPHGAGVSEQFPDMDGHWLSVVREKVGKNVPIIGTIDPHANVSNLMTSSTDALIAYKTNPHIDQRQVGKEAALLLLRYLKNEVTPLQILFQLPLIISIEQQYTGKDPCKSLYNYVASLSKEKDILSISMVLGFPYADVKEMRSSVIVVTDNNKNQALSVGEKIEEYIIERKQNFVGEKMDINAVLPIIDRSKKPVLLLDMGDNVGGGSSGNSTYLFEQLENYQNCNFFICLFDPEAVKQSSAYEPGNYFTIQLTNFEGRHLLVPVMLVEKGDGKFKETDPRHGGQVNYDMGKISVLLTQNGNTVMVMSLRIPPFSLKQLTTFHIKPETFDVIIAKGVNAPIAAYETVCNTIIQVNTPGVTAADMTVFKYKNRPVPLFPFES
ncbi:MAG TPA: M81 family metallopeptidase [Hanamia sp.]|nr:M81 family metallopeptidase [Hanamia sp.]